MKAKFQPTPSRIRLIQNCGMPVPVSPTQRRRGDQQRSRRSTIVPCAEARDQRSGDEARQEHRDDVPGDGDLGVGDRVVMMADHRERRRGHHEAHQRERGDRAEERDEEFRLEHDLAQRAPSPAGDDRRRGGDDEPGHHGGGDQHQRPRGRRTRRRPIRSGRIRPALIAICGPMMPLTTPAAMTHEIARGLNAGSAASAAAKRYCWTKAPAAPMSDLG